MKDKTGVFLVAMVAVVGFLVAGCKSRSNEPSQSSGAAGSGNAAAVKVRQDNPCSVLLPQEVEEIFGGMVVMREVVDEVTCDFPFEAGPKSQSPSSAKAAAEVQKGAHAEEQKAGEMAKTMATGMAGGKSHLTLKIYWKKGRTTIMATRLAAQLLGPDAKFEQLPGIGDEAWLGPMASTLVFVKGDVGVELDLRTVPNAREPGIRLAKLIAGRL